ncbi:hypothetical protein [Bartonella sp. CB189]|uniref:hypothetical protein n=1 Tax=Bartonella sp. CB189 TaxID=3112254 RepID=UPI002F96BFDC
MKRAIFFLCLLVLTACASTKLSGIIDPKYRNNFQIKKMIVFGYDMSIKEQKLLKNALVQSLAGYDIQLYSGLDVFPILNRDYSSTKEIYKVARRIGADTILIVNPYHRDVEKMYIPGHYVPASIHSQATGYVDITNTYHVTANSYATPGYMTPGSNLSMPIMNIRAYLKNTQNGETIWFAEGISEGSEFSSFSDLIIDTAKKVAKTLFRDGLISKKDSQKIQYIKR